MDRNELFREWDASLGPHREARKSASEAAVSFAQLGLKSCLLLNGGALIALPAYVSLDDACQGPLIVLAAASFVAGLVAGAIATLFAYQTMVFQTLALSHLEAESAFRVRAQYHPPEAVVELEKAAEQEREAQGVVARSERCRLAGVACYLVTTGGFVCGSTLALISVWCR